MTELIIITISVCIASIADGTVEGYEFDGRKSFEKKFGVDPNGFWGSLSHKNKNNWFYRLTKSTFDFYHVADDIRKYFYLAPFIVLYFSKIEVNTKNTISIIITLILSMLAKRYSMEWIRK